MDQRMYGWECGRMGGYRLWLGGWVNGLMGGWWVEG